MSSTLPSKDIAPRLAAKTCHITEPDKLPGMGFAKVAFVLSRRATRAGPDRAPIDWKRGSVSRVALLNCFTAAAALGDPAERHWEELRHELRGRTFEATLTNGVTVRARSIRVDPTGIEVDVRRTSDASLVKRGKARLDRQLFCGMRVERRIPGLRPLLAIGVACGAAWVYGQAIGGLSEGSGAYPEVAGALGMVAGGAVAGYYIGKKLGDRSYTIRIADPACKLGLPRHSHILAGQRLSISVRLDIAPLATNWWNPVLSR
jgi:hypothetical protein